MGRTRQLHRSIMQLLAKPLALLALASSCVAYNVPHPTLPTSWTATVKENEVGVVYESEHQSGWHALTSRFNPAAKWTNFTDGSCQRLIYSDDEDYIHMRFLLGCDSVACCTEDNAGDPYEYQIPNVHPAILAPVSNSGKQSITLFDKSTVNADVWSWKFGPAEYFAFTTPVAGNASQAILHQWTPTVGGQNFTNQYVNFTGIPVAEQAMFARGFDGYALMEGICKNAVKCDDAHKQGKLSAKHLRFARAGSLKRK